MFIYLYGDPFEQNILFLSSIEMLKYIKQIDLSTIMRETAQGRVFRYINICHNQVNLIIIPFTFKTKIWYL